MPSSPRRPAASLFAERAALLGLIALLSSCASAPAREEPESPPACGSKASLLSRLRLSDARDAAERCGDLRTGAEIRLLLGDAPGAERAFAKLLKSDPSDAKTSYGMALAVRERPETALLYADRAAAAEKIPGRRAAAFSLAAGIKLDLGDRAGAQTSYLAALAADENDLDSLDGLTRLSKDASYAARAERAAAAQPFWLRPPAFRLVARLWSALGDDARAAAAFRRAVDADPDDLAALEALVELKRARPATVPAWTSAPASPPLAEPSEADATRALASDPENLDALRRLTELARARRDAAAAAAFAERLQEAAWDAPLWSQEAAFRVAGRLWIELGDLDRASHSLHPAREFQARCVETIRLETITLRRTGGFTAFDGSLAWAHLAVARAYAELGNGAGARQSYEAAEAVLNDGLKSAPRNALALKILGEIATEKSRL